MKHKFLKCQRVILPLFGLLLGKMKNLSIQSENGLGSLHKMSGRSCTTLAKGAACGICDSCLLAQKLICFQEWFFHFGDTSKKQFMLGLLRQIRSTTTLQNIVALLNPILTKDCIYAKARTNPSLDTDTATLSSDHAVHANMIGQFIMAMWRWFSCANSWTQLNFTLGCLQMCEAHLLHTVYSQAHTLLASQLRSTQTYTGDNIDEAPTAESSECLQEPGKYPELDFQSIFQSESSPIVNNHFTTDLLSEESKNTVLSYSLSDSSRGSLDPLVLGMSTPAETPASISEHTDFIRYLPVHLSKMILGMLDTVSLYNALCVSPHWCRLAEEVRLEAVVNQQIQEEVMLMQGSAAHGANPVYAKDVDVLVPSLDLTTQELVYTDEEIINPTFKSEHNFQTAYSGISTKKVIVEERNIYCGAYNVMVLSDIKDNHRVVHADGSSWVVVGSKDRKVRFVDCDTGKETGPLITGHAGSITCCYLLHDRGLVLSGSYDTSIRCWSNNTGKCLKILRGHQNTVNCITVVGDTVASGSMDNSCKIWSLETGKCQHTFRHQSSVLTVALSEDICISGTDTGKVKVWQLASGDLIKILKGHHSSVTSIKFDRWHIITGGKDAYALVWSTVGRHSRCLRALRHPKEVLCLEFAYLRVITGSADGRIRIWNMLTGQCCRMMRGNSQSDPVLSINANGDRITVNTLSSLLVMNFEKVNWNYTMETDSIAPLTSCGSYSEFPLRTQPHSYVRAQRTRKAGAANSKLIHHCSQYHEDRKDRHDHIQHQTKDDLICYSAKSLSSRGRHGKLAQSILKSLDTSSTSADTAFSTLHGQEKYNLLDTKDLHSQSLHSTRKSKTRTKSATSQAHTVTTIQSYDDNEDNGKTRENIQINRRISWAFEQPLITKDTSISLSDMKTLLRSQIRMKAESIIPPDFIYLTVSTMQNTGIKSATGSNTKVRRYDWKTSSSANIKRPMSSPSSIDLKTKVPVDKLQMEVLHFENQTSGSSPAPSVNTKDMPKPQPAPSKDSFTTTLTAYPVCTPLQASIHPTVVKTTIPQGYIIRPVSAGPKAYKHQELISQSSLPPRPLTTPLKSSSSRSIQAVPANIAAVLPGAFYCTQRSRSNLSSAGEEYTDVPLFMSTKQIKNKIAEIKLKRKNQQTSFERNSDGQPLGEVSAFNHPLRPHAKFQLHTHHEEANILKQTQLLYAERKRKENEDQMKKKKAAWLALATGKQ